MQRLQEELLFKLELEATHLFDATKQGDPSRDFRIGRLAALREIYNAIT